ncbi:MAG: 2-hydroxychromene-2-carboxylate isomerase [Candidatus Binatia bacterium]
MPKTVEFFYDYSSPWTYLAFCRIEDVCRRFAARLDWRPILVGGIFNTVNPSVYESRERPVLPKARYMAKDLKDWAEFYALKLRFPPSVFPVNSVKSLRGALVALENGKISEYSKGVFAAYWEHDRDISRDDVLGSIVETVGLDGADYFTKIASAEYKDRVRANTDECIRRGGFGSPTMFIGDSMFFGNDRLVLLEYELGKQGNA